MADAPAKRQASAEDIDLDELRGDYEAVGRGDWDRAQRLQHPDIEWQDPSDLPDPGVYRGREAVRRRWAEFFDSWNEWRVEPQQFVPNGDKLLVETVVRASGRSTNIDDSLTYFQVYTVRDGLFVRQEGFFDREQALAAAGLDQGSSSRGD